MDFLFTVVGGGPATTRLYVTATGDAGELESVRDCLEAAIHGSNHGLDLVGAGGMPIRLIVDRQGAPRSTQ